MKELYSAFVSKLKKLFGKFDEPHKRFEKCSNSEIARELGYSDAQFSRLINETATEGEYQRAIQNIDRIIRITELEKALENGHSTITKRDQISYKKILFLILFVTSILLVTLKLFDKSEIPDQSTQRDNTLQWSFETSFINPYVKLDDLPIDCNYPCYKYQGRWVLEKGYKIPFFRERNGFHYLATEVNMYARCMSEKSNLGEVLEGYEYQKHEIWYDLKELPLDSFILQGNRLQNFYQDLDFRETDNFIKVATVHTFFRNEFTIEDSLIHRTGKVIGRDLEFESDEILKEKLGNSKIVNDIKNEINRISSNRLQDFSRPISCNSAIVPSLDIHEITDGAKLQYQCQLTTNRVSFNYTKTYVLENQFIKNRCSISSTN